MGEFFAVAGEFGKAVFYDVLLGVVEFESFGVNVVLHVVGG